MGKTKEVVDKCKCCLEKRGLRNMWSDYYSEGEKEIYGVMLSDCFALSWKRPSETDTEYICDTCIARLRDAYSFKKEILCTDQLLTEKQVDVVIENIKQEVESDVEMETQYLSIEYLEDEYAEKDNSVGGNLEVKEQDIYIYEAKKEDISEWKKKQIKSGEDIDNEDFLDKYGGIKEQSIKLDKEQVLLKGRKKKYTEDDLEKCLEAVRTKSLSQNKASHLFNVPQKTISRAIARIKEQSIKLDKEKVLLKGRKKKYTQDNLKKCLEAVRTKSLSQNKASHLFNVPQKTISRAIANEQLLEDTLDTNKQKRSELQKRQDNVDCIIKYTNATPFKGFLRTGYGCFFCSVEYENAIDLKEHTIVEHCSENQLRATVISDKSIKLDLTDLVCRICEESLDTLENMLDHLRLGHNKLIHTDVQNHLVPFKFDSDVLRCVVCSEEFMSFKLLNDHLNLNHFKNYECRECGRGFISKKSLRSHGYRHETGNFTCAYCPKIFTTRVRHWEHERSVHLMNNRRHKCGYCGERFITIARKKEHEVVVHNAAKITYECQGCNKIYDTRKALWGHVRSCHPMLSPFMFSQNGIGVFKKVGSNIHIVKHSGDTPELSDPFDRSSQV